MIIIKQFIEHNIPQELLYNSIWPNKLISDELNNGSLFCAYYQSDIVGAYILICKDDANAEITGLIVDNKYKELNTDKLLIEHAINQARLIGINRIQVGTIKPMENFYEQFGFRNDETINNFFMDTYGIGVTINDKIYYDKIMLSMFL